MATSSHAAWTVALVTTGGYPATYKRNDNSAFLVYRVSVTSDASSSGTQTLSTLIDTAYGTDTTKAANLKNMIKGGFLYCFKYSHTGTVTAPTIVLSDGLGAQILSFAAATSGAGAKAGNTDTSFYVPITDITFTSTTLGNGGVSVYEFWILK